MKTLLSLLLARIFHAFSAAIAASSSWSLRSRLFGHFLVATICKEIASLKSDRKVLPSLRIDDFATKNHEISGLVCIFVSTGLWSCAPNGLTGSNWTDSLQTTPSIPEQSQSQPPGTPPTQPPANGIKDPLTEIIYLGSIVGGPFDKLKSLEISKLRHSYQITIPMGPGYINDAIPQRTFCSESITFSVNFTANFRPLLNIQIPLQKIVMPPDLPVSGLPNSEPLPFLDKNVGVLPHCALEIDSLNKIKLHLFFGPGEVAAYVESPYDTGGGIIGDLGLAIRDSLGQNIGQYRLFVPRSGNIWGGYLVSGSLPKDLTEKLIEYYKKQK